MDVALLFREAALAGRSRSACRHHGYDKHASCHGTRLFDTRPCLHGQYLLQQRPAAPDALVHGVMEAVVGQVPREDAEERRQGQRLRHRCASKCSLRERPAFLTWVVNHEQR